MKSLVYNAILLLIVLLSYSCKEKYTSLDWEPGEHAYVSLKHGLKMKEAHSELVMVDVRTQEEYQNGSIPTAINLDYFDEEFKVKLNEMNKEKPYMVFCKSGNRSAKACSIMKEEGFNTVFCMTEGYDKYLKMQKDR